MSGHTLITGGAGFVGTNVASRLLSAGRRVVVLDDLSRPGVSENLRWLREHHRYRLEVVTADIRDGEAVRAAVARAEAVFHFAAQVAVTTSVSDPRHDFEVNLGGTLTLLEELRRLRQPPPLLFTSTNKVYGALADVALAQVAGRYEPVDPGWRTHGIGEDRPLSFASPYGCSKGGADQYVLDYAKSFQLPTVVFRMSCIYGRHQQGNEDQGWVAHFAKRVLADEPIVLYGDGRQVRDVLCVDDLVDAMLLAMEQVHRLQGEAFNIGGGASNAVSLLELLDVLGRLTGRRPRVELGPWRVGDQRWYVSDTRRFQAATGWVPQVSVAQGAEQLCDWLRGERRELTAVEAS